tara:strand:+ start:74 stop:247 length:174 start_codon:yes stop_codon:yes gene_type:complete
MSADSKRDLVGHKEGPGREVSEARRAALTARGMPPTAAPQLTLLAENDADGPVAVRV